MPIVGNRYYNDPALGAAFANIAKMYAPPSAQDAAAYATAAAKREEASRLATLFDYTRDPNFDQAQFDRLGIGAGAWTPNQGYYAVDQNNATQRYGYDTQARTSTSNNAADNVTRLQMNEADNARALQESAATNQRSLIGTLYGPLSQGQVRPALPSALAEMYGLPEIPAETGAMNVAPGEQITLPDGRVISGAPKPMTESETIGGIIQRQPQAVQDQIALGKNAVTLGQGQIAVMPNGSTLTGPAKPMTDAELKAQILGGLPLEQQQGIVASSAPVEMVADPNGQPRYAMRSDAVGQPAYVNRGAEAAAKTANYAAPNGRTGTAYFDPATKKWLDTATGTEIPPGSQTFSSSLQGGQAETGIGKPVQNSINQQLLDIAVAKDTAIQLRGLIAKSPASQGVIGALRGTAQNVIQMGGEVGSYFGGEAAAINDRIRKGLEDASLAGAFDPSIPAIEMLSNLLAFQYAKTTTGERLSNEMLRASRAALGLEGITTNQADAIARLDTAIKQIERQEGILRASLQSGSIAGQTAPPAVVATPMQGPAASPAAPDAPPPGVPPEDWQFLTPEEKALWR